jgi:hypothetical protein
VELRLEHSPEAERDSKVVVWERWRVTDADGAMVGFVAEYHEWLGHTYSPATYHAIHNPTGQNFKALWRGEGYETPREALEALSEHLRSGRRDRVAGWC